MTDRSVLAETLRRLVADLCIGLAAGRYRGRTVTIKIRLRPFRTYTRSRTLDVPTRDAATVEAVARGLLAAFELDAPVRLLGVGVASLTREAPQCDETEGEADQERLELTL